MTKRARIGPRALLIEEWDSHNLSGSALIASIRVLLQWRCHSMSPGPTSLPRGVHSNPDRDFSSLSRTEPLRWNSQKGFDPLRLRKITPQIGDSAKRRFLISSDLTEFRLEPILSFDTEAQSSRVQERNEMRIASAIWRRSQGSAAPLTKVFHRPIERDWVRVFLMFALGLILLGNVVAPLAAAAQNLGTSPQFGQAVQGQQATTVEGTVLNIVNWGCNVIAPVIAVACLGVAGWHFKSGRGYLGWGVTGVALMVISGLGRMAEGFITQAQGIQ